MATGVFKKITEWIMEAAEKPPKNLPETPEPYEDDPDNPVKQRLDALLAKAQAIDEETDPIDWVVLVIEWRVELLAFANALYSIPTGDPDTHPDALKWALDAVVIRLLQKKASWLTTAFGAVGVIQIEPDPVHEGRTRQIFDYDKLIKLITNPTGAFAAPDRPSAVAYHPTGTRLAQSSADYHIRIWDLAGSTSQPIKDLRGHPGRINDVAFSPDGTLVASAADDHTVRIWDADPAGPDDQVHVLDKHFLSVWSVAWNDDGSRLASGSSDQTVRTWTSSGGEEHKRVGHEGKVLSVAYNPAGTRIVSASSDKTVRVWDAASDAPALLLRGHAGTVWSAAFNHDGTRIVSAGDDGTIRTWNATTGEPERVFEGHEGRVFSVAFSDDGSLIVSAGEDQAVRIWNSNDEAQPPTVLQGHQSRVWSAAFKPGDPTRLASSSQDKLVLTWESGDPNPVTYGTAEDVIGQPPEVWAAVAAMAPTLGGTLIAGDLTVADLDPPVAHDPATPWGSFRAAAGQWLSVTIPQVGNKDETGDRVFPDNLFEIASGREPDCSTTWAVRADHYTGLGGADVRDFETWFHFTPELDCWKFVLHGDETTLEVEPAVTLGFGYDGSTGRWHGAIAPEPGSEHAPAAPEGPVLVRVERTVPGAPDLVIGPLEGMRITVEDVAASLAIWDTDALTAQAGDPNAPVDAFVARARLEGFNFHIDPSLFAKIPLVKYLAGKKGERFRHGLDVDLEGDVTFSPEGGLRINSDAGLETLFVLNRGPDWLKLHSVRLRVDLNTIENDFEWRVLLTTHLSSKATFGGTGYVLVLDGLGTWFGSMMKRAEDGSVLLVNGVPERWHWGLILPSGIGLEFIGEVVRGGGYIYRTDLLQALLPDVWIFSDDPVYPDEERFAGLLYLKIRDFEAIAFGIHEVLPDSRTSTIIVMGIRNKPGIQLPLGFRLIGIGGILGINRRADLDAFKQFMSIGATGSILITDDPVRNAPTILGDLDFLFPIENGVYVFGPTFRLVWLSEDIVQIDLALVVEYGSASADAASQGLTKIVIFGTARAKKEADGRKLLNLQIDILGVIDPAKGTFALDGNLVNSKVLEAFSATGTINARFFIGNDDTLPYAMIAVGGFHPRFNPEPARFEKTKRIGLAYKGRGSDKLKISAEAYVAFTLNTLQHGAKLSVRIKAGSVSAEGEVSYDVLIQFIPFYFDVGLAAKIAVKYRSKTLAGVSFAGIMTGPGPVTLQGEFTFEILFFDFSWRDTIVIGNRAGQDVGAIASLLDKLAPSMTDPDNLVTEGPDDDLVIGNPQRPKGGECPIVAPNERLIWSQKLSPLDCLIDRFGGVPLARPQAVEVSSPGSGTTRPYREWFSPGSFATLDEAEALNRAAFEKLDSGVVFGTDIDTSVPVGRLVTVNVFHLPRANPTPITPGIRFPTLVLEAVDGRSAAAATFERRPATIRARDARWTVRGGDGAVVAGDLSETDAHMRARYGAATAARENDLIELGAI